MGVDALLYAALHNHTSRTQQRSDTGTLTDRPVTVPASVVASPALTVQNGRKAGCQQEGD